MNNMEGENSGRMEQADSFSSAIMTSFDKWGTRQPAPAAECAADSFATLASNNNSNGRSRQSLASGPPRLKSPLEADDSWLTAGDAGGGGDQSDNASSLSAAARNFTGGMFQAYNMANQFGNRSASVASGKMADAGAESLPVAVLDPTPPSDLPQESMPSVNSALAERMLHRAEQVQVPTIRFESVTRAPMKNQSFMSVPSLTLSGSCAAGHARTASSPCPESPPEDPALQFLASTRGDASHRTATVTTTISQEDIGGPLGVPLGPRRAREDGYSDSNGYYLDAEQSTNYYDSKSPSYGSRGARAAGPVDVVDSEDEPSVGSRRATAVPGDEDEAEAPPRGLVAAEGADRAVLAAAEQRAWDALLAEEVSAFLRLQRARRMGRKKELPTLTQLNREEEACQDAYFDALRRQNEREHAQAMRSMADEFLEAGRLLAASGSVAELSQPERAPRTEGPAAVEAEVRRQVQLRARLHKDSGERYFPNVL